MVASEHIETVLLSNWLRQNGYMYSKIPSETYTKSWNQKRKNKTDSMQYVLIILKYKYNEFMPKKQTILTLQKFNRWTVLSEIYGYRTKGGCPLRKFLCECECGNQKEVFLESLMKGTSKSCGCLQKENHAFKHNMSRTRFYNMYRNIVWRTTPGHKESLWHGDKGIACEWNNFEDFMEDMYTAYIEHSEKYGEKNTTIDRIKNSDGYSKENCIFSTPHQQNRNMKTNVVFTYNGETKILKDWCDAFNLPYKRVNNRINSYGWTIEEALGIKKRIGPK